MPSRSWLPVRPVIISAKLRDITGQGLDVRAAFGDLAELFLLFWAEAIGAGQQPAGDLAGFRHGWPRLGRGECLPERGHVAADGLHAAGPAALLQSGVQCGGVGDAFVPPLAKVVA